jgi:N-6 DNA Methylase
LPTSPASFRSAIEKLTRRFESDRNHYLSKDYSEAQARVDFITPFFKALGWDVENEEGLPHHAREVVVETAEDTRGRPDYGFRVAGQTKFFVEAKAPSEELDTAKHIIQAKTYAWNTKQVFFVVLTDFEELRFYDASIQPDLRKPDEGLLLKLKYTDYIKNLERLWEFAKERVLAGSLEALLPRDRRTQRLRIPVDTAFLDEMTGWREEVAKNVYKNNPGLTAKQLNEIVQRLLDRIVFIRIAEDRRVIEKNQLREAVEEWKARGRKFHIFDWLNDLFHRINEDFNGEIFKPHLSEEIKIDSELLARIIDRLYPPQSPYRFDVIGVELLGSIYERYLGSTIRVTAKRVFVEEKPEVRKAGGVYYTPEYVVNYIVQNTVGKLIDSRTPRQIEKMRILDPACGSGSFLIGAFQCLIDHHVRYLMEHPKEAEAHPLFPDVIKGENGEPRLSVIRKARILRNNLYGVDIDPQAVEITMMSLYLKALEGERSQLPPKQHLLPELKYNVICGNSLIGPDIYEQGTLFGDEERDHINAFDWNSDLAGFGRIMKGGGFDCVIGNPPYLYSAGQEYPDYFSRLYDLSEYQTDFYVLFVDRSLSLAKRGGKVSFIVSDSWLNSERISKLRNHLLTSHRIDSLAVFDFPVFEQAVLENSILVVTPGEKPKRIPIVRFSQPGSCAIDNYIDPAKATARGLIDPRISTAAEQVIAKVEEDSQPLQRFLKINRGIHAYRTDGYGKSKFGPGPQTKKDKETQSYHAQKAIDATYLPELKGKDIGRYNFTPTGEFI